MKSDVSLGYLVAVDEFWQYSIRNDKPYFDFC